jgi:hypothetical protein
MWSQSHVGVSLNSILHVYDDTMKVQGVLAGHIWPHGVRCGEIRKSGTSQASEKPCLRLVHDLLLQLTQWHVATSQ